MNFVKDGNGKIIEVCSKFEGVKYSLNRIWLPAWTPGELREIADQMENGWVACHQRIDEKPKYGDPWKLTPEQRDLDEQINGDDDRPY
jgi:hypothetical protein